MWNVLEGNECFAGIARLVGHGDECLSLANCEGQRNIAKKSRIFCCIYGFVSNLHSVFPFILILQDFCIQESRPTSLSRLGWTVEHDWLPIVHLKLWWYQPEFFSWVFVRSTVKWEFLMVLDMILMVISRGFDLFQGFWVLSSFVLLHPQMYPCRKFSG